MVKIITPVCNREILQQSVPEAMLYTFEGLPEEEKVLRSMDWADVIVAGPGMGTGQAGALLMESNSASSLASASWRPWYAFLSFLSRRISSPG